MEKKDTLDKVIHDIIFTVKWLITLATVAFTIYQFSYNDKYDGSLALIATVLICWGVWVSMYEATKVSGTVGMLTFMIGALGASANTNILDSNYVERNADLFIGSTKLDYCPSLLGYDEQMIKFRTLKEELFSKCITQNHGEMMDYASDLAKAEKTGAVTGLLVSVYDEFNKKPEPKSCQDVAVEIKQLCPELNL